MSRLDPPGGGVFLPSHDKTHYTQRPQGFLPQLDEVNFTTGEKKIFF